MDGWCVNVCMRVRPPRVRSFVPPCVRAFVLTSSATSSESNIYNNSSERYRSEPRRVVCVCVCVCVCVRVRVRVCVWHPRIKNEPRRHNIIASPLFSHACMYQLHTGSKEGLMLVVCVRAWNYRTQPAASSRESPTKKKTTNLDLHLCNYLHFTFL